MLTINLPLLLLHQPIMATGLQQKVPMLLLAKTPHVPKPPILSLSIKSLHNLLEIIGRINNPE